MESDYIVTSFTYGTYPSADGSPVTFDAKLMSDLERNTNFVIEKKILSPPVEYDWLDVENKYHHGGMSAIDPSERTDAHGRIGKVEFKDGAVRLHYVKTSQKLRDDINAGKRIRTSPVFVKNYWYNDEHGVKRNVGPVVVGTTVLGAKRPAMRNPLIVPLDELPKRWGEQVHPADAEAALQSLRTTGLVAQTFDDDRFMFSEVDVTPRAFHEEKKMDENAIQALIDRAVAAAVTPLKTENQNLRNDLQAQAVKLGEQETTLKAEIAKFSQSEQTKADTKLFCENYAADRTAKKMPVSPLFREHMETVLNHADLTSADLRKEIKALCESANGAVPPTGAASDKGKKKEGAADDDTEEPKALSEARLRHFANLSDPANQAIVESAIVALNEYEPELFAKATTEDQKQDITLNYIRRRDNGESMTTN